MPTDNASDVVQAPAPSPQAIAELTPTDALRVGLNMANFLLVTGRDSTGAPTGVSPDVGHEVARRLGVAATLVEYASPGHVADAAADHGWDIGNIGAEPQRAEKIAFSPAYCEIAATYLVPSGSPITRLEEVDRPGVRIAVYGRAAYGLYLQNHIRHATLIHADSIHSMCSWRKTAMRLPVSRRDCSMMCTLCRARVFWRVSSRPFSRPSVHRGKMRRRRGGCRRSWKS